MKETVMRLAVFAIVVAPAILASAESAVVFGGPERPLFSTGAGTKTVRARVVDAPEGALLDGMLVREGDRLKVRAKKPLAADRLVFDVHEIGYYHVVADLKNVEGKVIAKAGTDYAVLPPIAERPQELGMSAHVALYAPDRNSWKISFDMLEAMGVSRLRDDLTWGAVEPRPCEYTIPERIEKFVDMCMEYRMKPLFVFGYSTPAYKDYREGIPTNDAVRVACANAMAYAVKHFRGKVTEWELWNEPNAFHPVKDYLPLLTNVYPRVKAASPEITLISCGGAGPGGGIGAGFIAPVLQAGGRGFQDGWSAHPYTAPHSPDLGYRGGPPLARASLPASLHFNGRLAKVKKPGEKDLSFWITEYGFPVGQGDVDEKLQAAYAARTYLLSREQGVASGVFWYDFQDDGVNPLDSENNFGLVRYDFSPKPSYQAVAVFAALFGNKKTVSCTQPAKDVRVLTCGEEGSRVTAIWGVEPTEIEIDWPAPRERLTMYDWQGRKLKLPEGEKLKLKAGKLPQYLVAGDW